MNTTVTSVQYATPHKHLILDIPIADIYPSAENPRTTFDPTELANLAKSIKEHGQIEPIVVRWHVKAISYELVAGERRLRAANIAGLTHLTAILREDLDDRQARALRLIENLHRVQLNPVEEAHGFAAMHEALGMTQAEIAKVAGRGQPAVAKRLALLKLPAEVQGYVERGTLSQAHADALANLLPFPPVLHRIADLAASQHTPSALLEKVPQQVWETLATEKLVRGFHGGTLFDKAICAACPFGAKRTGKGTYGTTDYCLRPDHFDELQAAAKEAKVAEIKAKDAAVAAAGDVAAAEGLPSVNALQNTVNLGQSWITCPATCTAHCPCRARAVGYNNEIVPVCLDRPRWTALKQAEDTETARIAAAALERKREDLAALLTGTRFPYDKAFDRQASVLLVRFVADNTERSAFREAAKTYGNGLTWPAKEREPRVEDLLKLAPADLQRIAIAAVIGDELIKRQNWSSSPLPLTEWLLGGASVPAEASTDGVCSRCGEPMTLVGEDIADPAAAICTECA